MVLGESFGTHSHFASVGWPGYNLSRSGIVRFVEGGSLPPSVVGRR